MNVLSVYFVNPGQVTVGEESLPEPREDQVSVRVSTSAISAGTEMLIYRGQFPEALQVDTSISALTGVFSYPLKYGYASVGQVAATGPEAGVEWRSRRVFAFQPHTSGFLAKTGELIPIPEDIADEDAVFLANMETAVNLILDGSPRIGEKVVVFGQGIVGLLATALLALFPLDNLVTLDRIDRRRRASLDFGASTSLDSSTPDIIAQVVEALGESSRADLVYELSGFPAALDQAIGVTGFSGRVVIGSWYGMKRAPVDLGGHFHRSRMRLVSSQVSTIAPELSGRWTKGRRLDTAWKMLRRLKPSRLVTHRFPVHEAADAYRLIDQQPEEAIQVLLNYE